MTGGVMLWARTWEADLPVYADIDIPISVLVFLGSHYKEPQVGWLAQQIASQFWRLKV